MGQEICRAEGKKGREGKGGMRTWRERKVFIELRVREALIQKCLISVFTK